MSAGFNREDAEPGAWNREHLFLSGAGSITAKFSVLPAEMSNFVEAVSRVSQDKLDWKMVAQSVGVGLLQMSGDASILVQALQMLRAEAEKLGKLGEMSGGSLIVLRCPTEMKLKFDVWGPTSDAQPLFMSVKKQFDPLGTLNPRRFIGGI